MDDRAIAFFDSGVGGLPYLALARRLLPRERFLYLADNANFPYGVKSPEELRRLVVEAVGRLIEVVDPKLIVIACNTASVIALEALRERYPVPFVGVVPAVKPAAERSKARKIALLATMRTVGDDYSDRLIRRFASDCAVVRIAGQELVAFIENEFIDATRERVRAATEAAVAPLLAERVDSLILGCTHFTFVDRELKDQLGSGVEIVDSREGVGRRVVHLLEQRKAAAGGRTAGDAALMHTAPDDGHYERFAERFGIGYRGVFR